MPGLDSFGPRHALVTWSWMLWPLALGYTWSLVQVNSELSMLLALTVAALSLGVALLLPALWLLWRRSRNEENRSVAKVLLFWATCSASIGVLGLCL